MENERNEWQRKIWKKSKRKVQHPEHVMRKMRMQSNDILSDWIWVGHVIRALCFIEAISMWLQCWINEQNACRMVASSPFTHQISMAKTKLWQNRRNVDDSIRWFSKNFGSGKRKIISKFQRRLFKIVGFRWDCRE